MTANRLKSSPRASEKYSGLVETYQYRFRDFEQKKRESAWKVIATYVHLRMGRPAIILDPAAGRGEFLRFCPAGEKWAVDLAEHSEFQETGIRFVKGDSLRVRLPEAHFDGVFISNFLEHLSSTEEVGRLLSRMHQCLKPGGVIAIMGPNFKYAFREYYDFHDHKLPLTDLSLDELLHIAGFETKERFPRFLPYSFKGRLPSSPWIVSLYLRLPFMWRWFGKQFFIVGRKK